MQRRSPGGLARELEGELQVTEVERQVWEVSLLPLPPRSWAPHVDTS